MAKYRPKAHRVFVSHASDDIWVAEQIARNIEECGATSFLDRRDIAAGDDFNQRIHREIAACDESRPGRGGGHGFVMKSEWSIS
jgi:hypothetical protein